MSARSPLLLLGPGGMLGRELMELAARRQLALETCGRERCELTDAGAVERLLATLAPRVVINCAAWTAVDEAEREPARAFAVNRDGAANLARACAAVGARLIHLSSDYVYAPGPERPRREQDPLGSDSVYGRSKLEGEQAVLALAPSALVVRTAWLYGRHGRNFVDTILAAARAGRPLRVVDDQRGSPTWARDLARALLELCELDASGALNVANRGAASWYQLACEALRLAGLGDVRCEPVASSEFPRPAARPAYSVLDCSQHAGLGGTPLASWQDALARYLVGEPDTDRWTTSV